MQRRRRRDEAFARLTNGRVPQDEAEVTNIYNVAVHWASYDVDMYDRSDWREVVLAAREFVQRVDEDRAEAAARLTAPASTSKRLHEEFVELRTRMYAKWREYLASVDEERAERDHREPGPLSG